MRKIRKRIVSTALAAVLALSGIPYSMTAHAEETGTKTDAEVAVVSQDETEKENLEEVQTGTLAVNEANFPDAVFRSYLLEEFDPDGDGMINPEEVTTIYISSYYYIDEYGNYIGYGGEYIDVASLVSSLKGIEYFPNLQYLHCSENNLTSLDLSHNPALVYLECYNNNLTSLDVSHNSLLIMLWCFDNNLTSLDVSQNPALGNLNCAGNNLTSLDVSKNLSLEDLDCSDNNLTSLDVSHNPALHWLYCGYNNLNSLDLSNNTELLSLEYDYDKISGLNLSNLTLLNNLNLYFRELPKSGTLDLSGLGYQVEGLDMGAVNYSLELNEYYEYAWNYGSLSIYAKTLQGESSVPTVTGIYHLLQNRDGIVAGLCTEGLDKSQYEFSWYVCKDGKNWIMAQDWTAGNEWLSYQPDENGEYVLVGKARPIGGSDADILSTSSYFSYHHEICGKCQMPYEGEGGGYLIGFESYENPNQSYQYEMLVLDCTKLANGEDAWIYTTGKCGAGDGKALWTVWQPQYGYYWTLFRLYDADGNMLDEVCYGFQNI